MDFELVYCLINDDHDMRLCKHRDTKLCRNCTRNRYNQELKDYYEADHRSTHESFKHNVVKKFPLVLKVRYED